MEFNLKDAIDILNRTPNVLREILCGLPLRLEKSKGKSIEELLSVFESLRKENIQTLNNMNLTQEDLAKTGKHPDLGKVSLEQLLATWVAHDLDHIVQISRTI